MSQPEDDPVLKQARREMWVALFIWGAAFAWVVGYCSLYGYGRDLESIRYVLGFPDWVFWGIMLPWVICVILSFIYGSYVVQDGYLGPDNPDQDDDLGF